MPQTTHDRWPRAKELFQSALELPPDERAAFLETSCGGDTELYREVWSLLRSREEAGGFLSAPAVLPEKEDSANGKRPPAFGSGRRVGRYEVVGLLGAGGMGEVYRGKDTRLHREVALKFLPKKFSEDKGALERFEREARAASSLDHPNICTIHDVGEHEGQPFIVMALMRGQTLRDRIGNRPLKAQDVADYGIQIADGLEAAHGKRILHRDIKPANIFVTDRNEVKLLDFGLAKLASEARGEASSAGLSAAATQTAAELVTQPGTTLGTVAYMSPEQALGEELDARGDLFSLGVVLYEMATGTAPFKGPTVAAIFNEIINKPPAAPSTLQPAVPPELERIILKALEKDRALRYQTASDLGADLKRLRRTLQSGSAPAVEVPGLGRRLAGPTAALAGAAAAVTLAMIVLVGSRVWREPRESAPVSFQNAVSARVTDQAGPEVFPSLSPDGKSIVYAARATDNWDVFLQRIGGKNPINLTADSKVDDNHPAFSPDGEQIAFQSDRGGGGIYLMGATGESVRRLTDFGYHPAWSPDGKEIVFASQWAARPESRAGAGSQLWIAALETGEKRRVEIKGGEDAIHPRWSPNGHRIAYWASTGGRRDIWTVPASGGDAVAVTADGPLDWNPIWSPDGRYLYFSSDRGGSMNLWRVPIDERSGRLLGPVEAITTPSPDSAQITLSRDGRRLAYVQRVATRNVQKVAFDQRAQKAVGEPEWVTRGSRLAVMPEMSPRGSQVAFFTVAPSQEDLFVSAPDGSGLRQLTDDIYRDRCPRWSPDGRQLAFYSDRSGKYEAWVINEDGGGLRQISSTPRGGAVYPVWSPDGTRLAYNVHNDTTYVTDLRKPFSEQSPQALPRVGGEANFNAWSWSPDGRNLAGWVVERTGLSSGISTYSFEMKRFDKLTDFGLFPVWHKDGRRVMFCFKEKLYVVDTASKKVHEIMYAALSARTGEMLGAASFSPDGSTLYFSQGTIEADVWLLTAG